MTKTLKRLAFSVILNSFVRPLLPQTLNLLFVYQRVRKLFFLKVAALPKLLTRPTHCFLKNWNCATAFTTLYHSVFSTFSSPHLLCEYKLHDFLVKNRCSLVNMDKTLRPIVVQARGLASTPRHAWQYFHDSVLNVSHLPAIDDRIQ